MKFQSKRVKEIFYPLLEVSDKDSEIVELAKERDERRKMDLRDTMEARILQGVSEAVDNSGKVTPQDIDAELDPATQGELGYDGRGRLIKIGKKLKNWGFDRYKVRNASGVKYKLGESGLNNLITLLEQYCLDGNAKMLRDKFEDSDKQSKLV